MAYFPKDYFQGETRDGFYIEPMMKCAWAAQIEVMEVVAGICAKHGIRYFADWGTLLGAVRHQGFIPWDDDMDICMFREDYEAFLRIAPDELPEGWCVRSIHDNPFHDQLHTVIINTDRLNYSPEHLKRFHGCPYVTGLDLFPLDVLAPTPEEDQATCELIKILVHTARTYETETSLAQELLPDIEDLCNVTLDRSRNIKNQLMQLADQVCQTYNATGGSAVAYYADHVGRRSQLRLQTDWYRDCITLPFETITVAAPAEYDAVLKCYYGDYMTPVQGAQSHEYPFYRKQEQVFAECWVELYGKK